jgi:hypothetical protein
VTDASKHLCAARRFPRLKTVDVVLRVVPPGVAVGKAMMTVMPVTSGQGKQGCN